MYTQTHYTAWLLLTPHAPHTLVYYILLHVYTNTLHCMANADTTCSLHSAHTHTFTEELNETYAHCTHSHSMHVLHTPFTADYADIIMSAHHTNTPHVHTLVL